MTNQFYTHNSGINVTQQSICYCPARKILRVFAVRKISVIIDKLSLMNYSRPMISYFPITLRMESEMATARLDMRLSPEIKAKAEKASALLGLRSLTEYIVKLIDENSTKVIQQYESMTVENDIFDNFIQACEELQSPNQKLVDAAAFTKKQGIK